MFSCKAAFRMKTKHAQGRMKVLSVTDAAFEWIYSWPVHYQLEKHDEELLLNFAITWHFIDKKVVSNPMALNLKSLETLFETWLSIPANFLLDKDVQVQSVRLLSSLIDQIWNKQLDIQVMRQFSKIFAKAAADIESKVIAGCLKLAVVKLSVLPEILKFGNEIRKVPGKHYSCALMVIFRSKATSEDIENYYLMKNQAEQKVKIYKNRMCIFTTRNTKL